MNYVFGKLQLGELTKLSNVAFYLLAYHLVISGVITYNESLGNIPSIPVFTTLFFGIPFILFSVVWLGRMVVYINYPRYFWRNFLFILCLVYSASVITYNHLYNKTSVDVLLFNAVVVMWYFISYLIGTEVRLTYGKNGKRYIMLFYLILILNVFLNYRFGNSRIEANYDYLGIFLFLGDSFALWSLFTISQFNQRYISVFLVFTSIICLFLISSRSSLYGFMIVVPFIFRKTKNALIQVTFILIGIAGLLVFILNAESLMDSHMLKFLFTGDDHSFYLRGVIMDQNLSDIFENWFLGDYAGQLRHGVFGFYIHNYLSLWRQFGLLPFVIFIALLIPFTKWFLAWIRGKKYQEYDFLFYMVIFILVEIIFTRSYKSHFIWIALGLMSRIINLEYRNRKKEISSAGN